MPNERELMRAVECSWDHGLWRALIPVASFMDEGITRGRVLLTIGDRHEWVDCDFEVIDTLATLTFSLPPIPGQPLDAEPGELKVLLLDRAPGRIRRVYWKPKAAGNDQVMGTHEIVDWPAGEAWPLPLPVPIFERHALELSFKGGWKALVPVGFFDQNGPYSGRILLTRNEQKELVDCAVDVDERDVILKFVRPPLARLKVESEPGELYIRFRHVARDATRLREAVWEPASRDIEVSQGTFRLTAWPDGNKVPRLVRGSPGAPAVRKPAARKLPPTKSEKPTKKAAPRKAARGKAAPRKAAPKKAVARKPAPAKAAPRKRSPRKPKK